MKRFEFILMLIVILAGCAPSPTEIATPVIISPTVVPTSTEVSVTITPSPLPTEPPIPLITPDPIQVERWREYQAELAKLVLAQHPGNQFPYYEDALCEWDILGQANEKVYVWARCFAPNAGNRKPAVVHLATDGSIQRVEVPFNGSTWDSDIQRLFPVDIQEKINKYFHLLSLSSGRPEELRLHLIYRIAHPEVPPLIIVQTTQTP